MIRALQVLLDLSGSQVQYTLCRAETGIELVCDTSIDLGAMLERRDCSAVELSQLASELHDSLSQSGAALGSPIRSRRAGTGSGSKESELPPAAAEGSGYPASPGQQRLWFLDRFANDQPSYVISFLHEIAGPLDAERLVTAVDVVLERHRALHCNFGERDGQVFQHEHGSVIRLQRIRLEAGREGFEAARAFSRQQIMTPFRLDRDPLVRAFLLESSPNRNFLFVICHHIVTDGWSNGVLQDHISAAYNGTGPAHAPPDRRYFEHAKNSLLRTASATTEDFWRQRLKPVPPLTSFGHQESASAPVVEESYVEYLLPGAEASQIRAACNAHGFTPFQWFLAALFVLLLRETGRDDHCVGIPLAGRDEFETEETVGFFVDTLPLRLRLRPEESFQQLVAQLRDEVLECFDHQGIEFDRIVNLVNPVRQHGENPLFNVMFNYLGYVTDRLRLNGLQVTEHRVEDYYPKFLQSIYVNDLGKEFQLGIAFDRRQLSPGFMEQFVERLGTLAVRAAGAPEQPIELLEPPSPRCRPIPTIDTSLPNAAVQSVLEQVLDACRRHGNRTAVESAEWCLDYDGLHRSAERLAGRLRAAGVRPGQAVAIHIPPGADLVVVFLAIWLAGAVLLPLDPRYPIERKLRMCQLARPAALVSTCGEGDDAEALTVRCALGAWLQTDTEQDLLETRHLSETVDAAVYGAAAAYILFTSGTTGDPKGILGSHLGLGHFIRWERAMLEVTAEDRVPLLASPSFDPILRDMFVPLASGGCVVAPERELPQESMLLWLYERKVTILHAIPSLTQNWLQRADRATRLPHLRWVVFAGEPLKHSLVDSIRPRLSATSELLNIYGPTETTQSKFFYHVPQGRPEGIQPVGVPLPGTGVRLVGLDGRECASGEVGEVWITTEYASLGYIQPDLNRNAFSFTEAETGRCSVLYRTGDLGQMNRANELELVGRRDDQVKVRGVRVNLSGIAAHIEGHPAVKSSAVTTESLEDGTTLLVAYVVLEGDTDTESLRRFLLERLPATHVPTKLLPVAELPVTLNGKLDRSRLAQLTAESARSAPQPLSPTEIAIAEIWSEVLGVPVGRTNANFFELGGYSLLAMRVIARLREHFGLEVPLRHFFDLQTLTWLARYVEVLCYIRDWSDPITADCGTSQHRYALSP